MAFDPETARRIKTAKVFMVGAGGIGCELLKDLLLTGFRDIQLVRENSLSLMANVIWMGMMKFHFPDWFGHHWSEQSQSAVSVPQWTCWKIESWGILLDFFFSPRKNPVFRCCHFRVYLPDCSVERHGNVPRSKDHLVPRERYSVSWPIFFPVMAVYELHSIDWLIIALNLDRCIVRLIDWLIDWLIGLLVSFFQIEIQRQVLLSIWCGDERTGQRRCSQSCEQNVPGRRSSTDWEWQLGILGQLQSDFQGAIFSFLLLKFLQFFLLLSRAVWKFVVFLAGKNRMLWLSTSRTAKDLPWLHHPQHPERADPLHRLGQAPVQSAFRGSRPRSGRFPEHRGPGNHRVRRAAATKREWHGERRERRVQQQRWSLYTRSGRALRLRSPSALHEALFRRHQVSAEHGEVVGETTPAGCVGPAEAAAGQWRSGCRRTPFQRGRARGQAHLEHEWKCADFPQFRAHFEGQFGSVGESGVGQGRRCVILIGNFSQRKKSPSCFFFFEKTVFFSSFDTVFFFVSPIGCRSEHGLCGGGDEFARNVLWNFHALPLWHEADGGEYYSGHRLHQCIGGGLYYL